MIIVFYSSDISRFMIEARVDLKMERELISKIYHNVPLGEAVTEKIFLNRVRQGYFSESECSDLNLLFQDMAVPKQKLGLEEEEIVKLYFKNVYLHLNFNYRCKYRKIMLRSLLKFFGYQKRTTKLMKQIERILDILSIKTYLRGDEPCSISDVMLDDTLYFKLY